MKNSKSLTTQLPSFLRLSLSFSLFFSLTLLQFSCEKTSEGSPQCDQIALNQPFTAKIGETYCLPNKNWKITFGPFIEDSRCNVPNIECIWAGRYVMAALIEGGESERDTFFAERDWRDTLHVAPYTIILNKVFPETRTTMEPMDTSGYSFEIIIK